MGGGVTSCNWHPRGQITPKEWPIFFARRLARMGCLSQFGVFGLELRKQGGFTNIDDFCDGVLFVNSACFLFQGKRPEFRKAPGFRKHTGELAICWFGLPGRMGAACLTKWWCMQTSEGIPTRERERVLLQSM